MMNGILGEIPVMGFFGGMPSRYMSIAFKYVLLVQLLFSTDSFRFPIFVLLCCSYSRFSH